MAENTNDYDNLELKQAFKKYLTLESKESQTKTAADNGVQLRFRPVYRRTCKHDARGDAINLVVENMMEKNIPLWAINILACQFVDEFSDELHTHRLDFVEDIYDPIDAVDWCKLVNLRFEEFALKFAREELSLPIKPVEWNQYLYSLFTHKNRKPKMEDKHIVLPTLSVLDKNLKSNLKKSAFFAVFDGHSGSDCASYAASHFTESLLKELELSDVKNNEFLLKVFDSFDKRLTMRCKNENFKSGTTACCAYIADKTAYLAWCGDSSIGIFNPTQVLTLSERHLPNLPKEEKRINKAGGIVVYLNGVARVNGILNISRSLGDLNGRPMISQTPDLKTYSLISGTDLMLFLSSDGVWDTFSEAEIYNHVIDFVNSRNHSEYFKLADFIGQKAREFGTSDNLTLVIVFLENIEKIWEIIRNIKLPKTELKKNLINDKLEKVETELFDLKNDEN